MSGRQLFDAHEQLKLHVRALIYRRVHLLNALAVRVEQCVVCADLASMLSGYWQIITVLDVQILHPHVAPRLNRRCWLKFDGSQVVSYLQLNVLLCVTAMRHPTSVFRFLISACRSSLPWSVCIWHHRGFIINTI